MTYRYLMRDALVDDVAENLFKFRSIWGNDKAHSLLRQAGVSRETTAALDNHHPVFDMAGVSQLGELLGIPHSPD